ncbi:dolichyl-phosphate-mannose-protein mannosyltransferase [Halorhabdus tiamatea SARL4B]|nr:dolichyl-phosphate-mannose-protein mannosyltransferase [Halorhabdus tiamatea SARL4B]
MVAAVLAFTAVGLLARFILLGLRPAHWDEARVAYWVDYTFETGRFAYNSHTHGPVIQHLSRYLFGILGPSDTTIRIPVAIIGGLLPLSALLYREHLRDVEVIVLSGLLSANAVLLYYSRFMRSDLLVATFMFTAFGLFVRFYDTRRIRYLYAATVCIVLAVGSKENAPLYVLTWLGAGAIILDVALYRPRNYRGGLDLVATKFAHFRSRLGAVRQHPRFYVGHAIGIAVVALALFTVLFAPRGGGVDGIYHPPEGLSLWAALGSPLKIPHLVWDTLTYVVYPTGEYFAFGDMDAVILDLPGSPVVEATASSTDPEAVPYLSRLFAMGGGLLSKAPAVVGFGLVGVLYERYLAERSRTLVLFMFFAAVFSVIGYPLTLSIDAGWKWNMTHVVVPLAVPAAVGLGIVGRWATVAYRRNDRFDLGLSAVVIVIVALLVASVAVSGAYPPADRSEDNMLVQYGQPADDLRALDQLQAVAATNAGTDVVVYDGSTGDNAYVRSDPGSVSKDFRPTCTQWTNLLPMNWYLAAYDADSECEGDSDALVDRTEGDDPPPIVITRDSDATVPEDALETDYQPRTYRLRTYGSEATIYVHESVNED